MLLAELNPQPFVRDELQYISEAVQAKKEARGKREEEARKEAKKVDESSREALGVRGEKKKNTNRGGV